MPFFLAAYGGFAWGGDGTLLEGASLELALVPAYNRSFYFSWDAAASGSLALKGGWGFSGALALGRSGGEWLGGAALSAEYGFPFLPSFVPLFLKASYQYRGLAGYDTAEHCLSPLVSLRWRYFGFSLGPAFRFTYFGGEPPLYELLWAWSVYARLFKAEDAELRLALGNTGSFLVKNFAAFSCFLGGRFRLTERISLTGETEIAFSGNVGRLVSVYGIAVKQGVLFRW